MKKENLSALVLPLSCIVLGILAFVTANQAMKPICYAVGIVLCIAGIFSVIKYLTSKHPVSIADNGFVTGVAMLVLGIVAMVKIDIIADIIPFILGAMITVNGAKEFQNFLDANRLALKSKWAFLAVAAINIIFGIIMMVNPGMTVTILMKVIGCGLVISGLADLVITLMLSRKIG